MIDTKTLIQQLNEPQREAVTHPESPLLVLAGAGSGKTRVLVHRIAWMAAVNSMSLHSILAVTFTNKAAAEMRSRVESLLSQSTRGLWIGTFHGIAHRLLRLHHNDAQLPEAFQVLDTDDQVRLVKRIIKDLRLDDKQWPARQTTWFINSHKEEGRRAVAIPAHDDFTLTQKRIYEHYESQCQRSGLVDFPELLLRTLELLKENPELAEQYHRRFQHVLVDEFQDTNDIQYQLIRALVPHQGITVVGDDDQSIYGWRGARIENLNQFTQDYHPAKTIRLEQNYRSTSTVLRAANAVIANNLDRLGKELWTSGEAGEPIVHYHAFNEIEEARYVAESLREYHERDLTFNDMAVLYRSNAQSRVLEEALIRERIPYRIYGGLRFFERAEIKDALCYLRLIFNRNDDAAFERVINTPARGIGEKTLAIIREFALKQELSLWQAVTQLLTTTELSGRAKSGFSQFVAMINEMEQVANQSLLHQLVEHAIHDSGIFRMYQEKEKGEKWLSRKENLEELINAAREFDELAEEEEAMSPLASFLSHAALESGDTQAEAEEECVQLMTLHSAKGLEFPVVFMVGMEEKLFPHQMSLDEPGGLEEERRLCYVGITRAMQFLTLTNAEKRRLHGKEVHASLSRFVREIPDDLIKPIRITRSWHGAQQASYQQASPSQSARSAGAFQIGQNVSHPKFGQGILIDFEGEGDTARLQINFEQAGIKWLIRSYVELG